MSPVQPLIINNVDISIIKQFKFFKKQNLQSMTHAHWYIPLRCQFIKEI